MPLDLARGRSNLRQWDTEIAAHTRSVDPIVVPLLAMTSSRPSPATTTRSASYSIACVSTGTAALRGIRISNSTSSAGNVVTISST